MIFNSSGVKPPRLARVAFPRLIWKIPNKDNKIYLTFDDGPIPHITEWVLDTLDTYQVKATFFCVGENVKKHPQVYAKVLERGHSIGNHTFNHLNSWKTNNATFINNISESSILINTKLFRPPYGKIRHSLTYILKKKFKIIMWDVLAKDYDNTITPQECLNNVLTHTSSGSIIVFHDSIKAFTNLQYALPRAIEHLLNKGYVFDVIE